VKFEMLIAGQKKKRGPSIGGGRTISTFWNNPLGLDTGGTEGWEGKRGKGVQYCGEVRGSRKGKLGLQASL